MKRYPIDLANPQNVLKFGTFFFYFIPRTEESASIALYYGDP